MRISLVPTLTERAPEGLLYVGFVDVLLTHTHLVFYFMVVSNMSSDSFSFGRLVSYKQLEHLQYCNSVDTASTYFGRRAGPEAGQPGSSAHGGRRWTEVLGRRGMAVAERVVYVKRPTVCANEHGRECSQIGA